MAHVPPRQFIIKTGEEITVRSPEPADAAALVEHIRHELLTSEFSVTQIDEFTRTEATERQRIEESAAAPGHLSLIALHGGEIIANLGFRAHPKRRMSHHGSFGVGVSEPWRGRGVGRAIITTLLDWAAADPAIEKGCLGVFADNHRAIALYTSLGFIQEGFRPMEFKLGPGRYADDIQMGQWVKPVEGAPTLWQANNDGSRERTGRGTAH